MRGWVERLLPRLGSVDRPRRDKGCHRQEPATNRRAFQVALLLM